MYEGIVLVGRSSPWPLNTLLLLGDGTDEPGFVEVLQDALRELIPPAFATNTTLFFSKGEAHRAELNPVYIAARGAAEFAKRAQEAPKGCKERPNCAVNRRPPAEDVASLYGEEQRVFN